MFGAEIDQPAESTDEIKRHGSNNLAFRNAVFYGVFEIG